MLYSEYILKATEVVIEQADNGLFYLEPMWKSLLIDNNLDFAQVSDVETSWSEIQDILKLEVEKRNTINTLEPYVLNWIHDIITSTVEPAVLQEETDYLKNYIEYMKANKTQEWVYTGSVVDTLPFFIFVNIRN